jgi:glycosyltransferase involved in cell wall biosynthesis
MKYASVLIVFSSSELGGAERSLSRMAIASPPGIYQLATLDGEGLWCDWVRSQGQQPMVFGKRTGAKHGRLKFGALVSLILYVRKEGIQTIYICGLRASLYLRLLKSFMPNVQLVHGIRTNPDSNSRLDQLFRIIERWLNAQVDLYITNSKIAATTLIERCGVSGNKVQVIYNGLVRMKTKMIPIVKRPLNIITVANLVHTKGHLEYLSVIKEIHREIPDARFIFIGRDEMNGKVQEAISTADMAEYVSCEGFQTDVSSYFANARVCVVPSKIQEGSPTTVLEAMSYGVPVVAYNIDGLPELVRHGQDGFLVPIVDSKQLKISIIKLLKQTKLANKMSASSLARYKSEFQINKCVIKHQDALKLLEESK